MIEAYASKKKTIAVIGLGYVGLPVALALAKKFKVMGFDVNPKRVNSLQQGRDLNEETPEEEFQGIDISFTDQLADIKACTFYVVAVPTPIDAFTNPDLRPLLSACNTVGQVLKQGDVVVFESTVYPGCTEDDCVPVLEQLSGLSFGKDFSVGYSPERINPGDKVHTLAKITKVVSGSDEITLKLVSAIYGCIIEAGVHEASSIKVAEAAKVIENTQRDLNIALMNELSVIFKKMDINTFEVLEAAGTKWNFLRFTPGLVGGHCIGVDPYYLTYKANKLGYHSKVILSGRAINDDLPAIIAKDIVQKLIEKNLKLKESRVLVLGATFKENVSDIRNSKVVKVVKELSSYYLNVDLSDPLASPEELHEEYGLELTTPSGKYDAIVLAVAHEEYAAKSPDYFLQFANEGALFYDIKGIYRNKLPMFEYLSL